MKNSEFLLELYSEEIPSFLQNKYAKIIAQYFEDFLNEKTVNHSEVVFYSGPCRIVIYINSIDNFIPERGTLIKGPKITATDIAIEGFCKANSINKSDLIKQNINRIDYYFAKILLKEVTIKKVLEENIPQILGKIVWPKSMYWGNYNISWIRPLKNIICLLNSEIVKFEFGHLESNNLTAGHKFLRPLGNPVNSYSEYKEYLENNFVILDQKERKKIIQESLAKYTEGNELEIVPDERLLEEVTGLIEWPEVLIGSIDKKFLKIPNEILSTAIRIHQKYFSLRDKAGNFAPYFAFVCNIPENHEEVIRGNEKVLKARLNDAVFFYNQDLKHSLESRLEKLKTVSFHKNGGSIYDKSLRLQKICKELVRWDYNIRKNVYDVEPEENIPLNSAALLCKCDLVSEVVTEFPNLQGIMGYYYALNDKENEKLAQAIRDHYMPIGAEDRLPETFEGKILSLADKFDSLVMLYLAGERATGSKDPMALRRTAIAIIRLILEGGIRANINGIISYIYDIIKPPYPRNIEESEIVEFMEERLKYYLEDKHKYERKYLDAVIRPRRAFEDPLIDLQVKIKYLDFIIEYLKTEKGQTALYVYSRCANIIGYGLTDNETRAINDKLFKTEEEKKLHKEIIYIESQLLMSNSERLEKLAGLKYVLDEFFDNVLVNTDDPDLTLNRKNLLRRIIELFDQIADFSKLKSA